MSNYKVVPFAAQINRNDTTDQVAAQMQGIIDSYVSNGWGIYANGWSSNLGCRNKQLLRRWDTARLYNNI